MKTVNTLINCVYHKATNLTIYQLQSDFYYLKSTSSSRMRAVTVANHFACARITFQYFSFLLLCILRKFI
jgi:hypothetical protein